MRVGQTVDAGRRPAVRSRNVESVTELVAARVAESKGRVSAERSLPVARTAGYTGSARNFRRLVVARKALWRTHNHRGRQPAVWAPGGFLVFERATVGSGLHLFCAVLAWSRWRFVASAADEKPPLPWVASRGVACRGVGCLPSCSLTGWPA